MEHTYSKHRIEALSDGVFAIAMTLLVLDIKVPAGLAPGQVEAAVMGAQHEWISFLITFFLASSFWVLQHRVFDVIDRLNTVSIVLTFGFLCGVSVLPFSTSVWGHNITDRFATVVYFGNQVVLAVMLLLKLELAGWQGHTFPGRDRQVLRLRLSGMVLTVTMTLAGAFVVSTSHLIWVVAFAGVLVRVLRRAGMRRLEAAGALADA